MASRQEEKEKRRQERLAAEAAEAKAAGRLRRLQLVFGGILVALLLGGVAYAVLGGGDDNTGANGNGNGNGDANLGPRPPKAGATIPPPGEETDPAKAAKEAGCDLIHAKYEGAGHEERAFKITDYKTNPPTSGAHFPDWYEDGVYAPGGTPELGKLVHALEHGRIDVQYKPGTSDAVVKQLEALLAEKSDGYHALLFENGTDMPYQVAATAWTQLLGCKEMNPKVFDALRAFYDRYVDRGPEQVP